MTASNGYAVFFFPPALEALGDAIKPYLQDSPAGLHVLCNEIDTGGALLEMTIQGVTKDGGGVVLDLMVPTSMVRMIVSSQSDASFGFGPRIAEAMVSMPLVGVGASVDPKGDDGSTPGKSNGKGKAKGKKAAAKPTKGKPKAGSKSSKGKPMKSKSPKKNSAKNRKDEAKRKAVRKS